MLLEGIIAYYSCQTSMVAVTTVNPWWMLLICGHWIVHSLHSLFLVSTSALFDPLITEKCECFSLDLAAMLLLLWRIQMLSLLDLLLALCSNSVAWSRSARAALVQTDKRSFNHTITSSFVPLALRLPFDVGQCCGRAGVSYIMSALATRNARVCVSQRFNKEDAQQHALSACVHACASRNRVWTGPRYHRYLRKLGTVTFTFF